MEIKMEWNIEPFTFVCDYTDKTSLTSLTDVDNW